MQYYKQWMRNPEPSKKPLTKVVRESTEVFTRTGWHQFSQIYLRKDEILARFLQDVLQDLAREYIILAEILEDLVKIALFSQVFSQVYALKNQLNLAKKQSK